jgi:hypothetical protein
MPPYDPRQATQTFVDLFFPNHAISEHQSVRSPRAFRERVKRRYFDADFRSACGNDASAIALFGVGACSVQLPRAQASSLAALRQRLATGIGSLRRIEAPWGETLMPPAQLPALHSDLKVLFDPEGRLRPALFEHAERGS